MDNILIIYHAATRNKSGEIVDCPDGVISASIAYKALTGQGHRADVLRDLYLDNDEYKTAANPLLNYTNYNALVVVDFSYPKRWLEAFENEGGKGTRTALVLDHHMDRLEEFDLAYFARAVYPQKDKTECGATVTWKHFNVTKLVLNHDCLELSCFDMLYSNTEQMHYNLGSITLPHPHHPWL